MDAHARDRNSTIFSGSLVMNIAKHLGIAAGALLLTGLTTAASANTLVTVQHNTPPAVAKARFLSHRNPREVLDISLALPLRNGADFAQFARDVVDRSSPSYHKFLTPAQFMELYAPTGAQLATVEGFLTQHGIKVTGVLGANTRIHAQASVATLESAFGIAINNYSYQGQEFFSPSSDPVLPADVGSLVMAIMGMDNRVTMRSHMVESPRGIGVGPTGLMPQQVAALYSWPDVTTSATGAGSTIAIATAFNYRDSDLNKFWSVSGVPATTANITRVPVDGVTNTLNGETTLDVARSSAMAPGATLRVYECRNPQFQTFDDEFAQILDDIVNHSITINVVSTSWGGPESNTPLADIGAEHQSIASFVSGFGVVMLAAAGDDGSADRASGNDNADYPASDPEVVAAGGTTLTLSPGNGHRLAEIAWSGAGGADSAIFAVPGYQNGTDFASFTLHNGSCPSDLTTAPGATTDFGAAIGDVCNNAGNDSRQSSDMALDADPATGYGLYYNGRWVEYGGTSFVAPELAGLFADIVQQHASGNIGNGNVLIYCAGTGNSSVFGTNPNAFIDIISGSNGKFTAATGWDHPTGWGVPGVDFVANILGCI